MGSVTLRARIGTMGFAAAAFFGLLALASCAHLPLQLPTVAFHKATLRGVRLDVSETALSVDLGFQLRIHNPYGVALGVPAHQFRLLLDRRELPVHLGRKEAFELPPAQDTIAEYPVVVDLDPEKVLAPLKLLGREVPYTFVSDIEIELPFGLGPHSFRLVHEDEIRFPSLSQVRLGNPF